MNQRPETSIGKRALSRVVICLSVGLACGCFSKSDADPNRVPLAGKVTFDGNPLPEAEIQFFNENDDVGMITSKDGTFKIPIGALPGDYKVTISKLKGLDKVPEGLAIAPNPRENPETLPGKYSNRQRTVLTWTVPPEGTESANFDLTK